MDTPTSYPFDRSHWTAATGLLWLNPSGDDVAGVSSAASTRDSQLGRQLLDEESDEVALRGGPSDREAVLPWRPGRRLTTLRDLSDLLAPWPDPSSLVALFTRENMRT